MSSKNCFSPSFSSNETKETENEKNKEASKQEWKKMKEKKNGRKVKEDRKKERTKRKKIKAFIALPQPPVPVKFVVWLKCFASSFLIQDDG